MKIAVCGIVNVMSFVTLPLKFLDTSLIICSKDVRLMTVHLWVLLLLIKVMALYDKLHVLCRPSEPNAPQVTCTVYWTYLFLSFGAVIFAPCDISQTSAHEVVDPGWWELTSFKNSTDWKCHLARWNSTSRGRNKYVHWSKKSKTIPCEKLGHVDLIC